MKVIVVEPQKRPYVKEIGEGLQAIQETVGGWCDYTMPWRDHVALIYNAEGLRENHPLNRIIQNDEGYLVDVIAGTFILCYKLPKSGTYQSLSDDMIKKYIEKIGKTSLHSCAQKRSCADANSMRC